MIIKKAPIFQQDQDRTSTTNEAPRARIKIKLKKNNRFYNNQKNSEQHPNPKQANSLNNDNNDFNDQYCFLTNEIVHKQYKKINSYTRDFTIQIINENKKDNSETFINNFAHSKKIILQSLKNNAFQINNSQLFHSEQDSPKIMSQRRQIAPLSQFSKQLYDMKPNSTHTQLSAIKQLSTTNMRLNHENKSCSLVNPYTKKEYFHERVTQSSKNERFSKKFNTLDYSIIKPNQIKAFPLSYRSEPKTIKRKHERKHFPQLIAALKRKEQLQRQRAWHERRIAQIRAKNNTVYLNKARPTRFQKNQVQPWQVQALSNNIPDFI